jgi:hypothetical protein
MILFRVQATAWNSEPGTRNLEPGTGVYWLGLHQPLGEVVLASDIGEATVPPLEEKRQLFVI